jgi:hypothetical protein
MQIKYLVVPTEFSSYGHNYGYKRNTRTTKLEKPQAGVYIKKDFDKAFNKMIELKRLGFKSETYIVGLGSSPYVLFTFLLRMK